MADLKDKVIIVTGAARGLGRQYAVRLAEAGAKVVAGDVRDVADTAAAINSAGGEALGIPLDVADASSCRAMAAATLEAFGRVDGLINNAALYGGLARGKFDTLPEDEWQRVMDVNVTGIWNCCRAVAEPLRESKGSIVNVASLAAVFGMPNGLHYATSKAAVIGMTRAMARELGRDWVRVNAVAPAAVLTEGTEEFFGDKHEKATQAVAAGQSLQRNLEPDDMVGTIMYLLSDDSKFVTGQTIMVDGGTVFL